MSLLFLQGDLQGGDTKMYSVSTKWRSLIYRPRGTDRYATRLRAVAFLASATLIASAGPCHAVSEETGGDAPSVTGLQYENGILNGGFQDVPLGRALQALAIKTGLEVHLTDEAIGSWPISAEFEQREMAQAIIELLDGFSYALYPNGKTIVVIILSTPPGRPRIALKIAKKLPSVLKPGVETGAPPPGRSDPPQTLDDFRPLTVQEIIPSMEAKAFADQDPAEQQLREQEQNEEILSRALDVLRSEHRQLHVAAMDELAGIKDPRATQALLEAALSRAGVDAEYRFQSVAALSRHAEKLQFADASSVDLLKQLASDSDLSVRSIAREALRQMEQAKSGDER